MANAIHHANGERSRFLPITIDTLFRTTVWVRQNAGMNRLALSSFVLLIAGCGTPPNQVISLHDGTFRAPFYDQAIRYCQKDGLTASMLGNGPAQTGILFRCQ